MCMWSSVTQEHMADATAEETIRKVYQWLTNSRELAVALSRKLTKEEQMYCAPLIGKEVRLSARYPEKMCRAILRAIKVEARRRWPQRFLTAHEVLYQEPMQGPAAWMDVLRQVHRIFGSTTVRSFTLADTDPLHHNISNLVPWELIRVQVTRTPVQRRLPRDIRFTHRGAVLEYQDGQLKPKHWMACISQSSGSPKAWPMASSGMGLAIPSIPHHQRSNLPNMMYHNPNETKSNLHG